MSKQGVVVKIKNGIATISCSKGGGCGGECLHCNSSCTPKDKLLIESKIIDNVVVGSHVSVDLSANSYRIMSFYGYVIPIVTLLISFVIFNFIFKNQVVILFLTLFATIFSFWFISKFKKIKNLEYEIKKIIC